MELIPWKADNKKAASSGDAAFSRKCGSTLGELEALASTGLAGLFAFLHAWVTGEETERLDELAVFWIHLRE